MFKDCVISHVLANCFRGALQNDNYLDAVIATDYKWIIPRV